MTGVQMALMRRELWEHRAIYVVPLVMALIITLMSVTGQVVVSAFDHVVDIAILGASNVGPRERAVAISVITMAVSSLFVLTMWILTIFYLLDSLYAERRDKSILFWRSLPVTDTETVLSKLLTAVVVIPLVTFAVAAFTQLIVLAISSLWVEIRGGSGWSLIFGAAPIAQNWLALLIVVLAIPLWLSPFVGWFLFVSGWTRRSPFLVAFLPLVVAPMLERILLGTSFLHQAIFLRSGRVPLFRDMSHAEMLFEDGAAVPRLSAESAVSLLPLLDLPRFLSSPGLWGGILVCALFTAAAIYVRRYRDES